MPNQNILATSAIREKKTVANKVAKAGTKKAPAKPKVATNKKPAQPKAATPVIAKDENLFPIVGMGASAGGLEAVENFFKTMPEDSGMAFVLVTHLDPTHISIMPELVQKSTNMKVYPVKDGMKVQPNCVYIIPPNNDMAILHGSLQLIEPAKPSSLRLPIDFFFRSLAQDCGRKAICIILSGTGTDGTLGLKTIRGEEGMVMVQDPKSAKYEGMPKSAIDTGVVDYVLPPEKMPKQLIKYIKHPTYKASVEISPVKGEIPDALQKIFVLIRQKTGHDFSTYKKNTICRGIERRMNIHQIGNVSDYVRYLKQSPHEVEILFKELLIGVTNFFRDVDAFEILKNKVFPQLLNNKSNDYAVRVWVPGCSSGEEAYSIAIILHEYMSEQSKRFNIQIFGTDIDNEAIEAARSGYYPQSITADVSPERLKQFFTKEGNGFRIKKDIREMLVFAPQNIIKDPPFTKLDLISCRNLLIYLDAKSQKKLLPVFHYSLKTDGVLFLGSSETIGGFVDLFSVVDKKWKFFKCKKTASQAHIMLEFPIAHRTRQLPGIPLKDRVKQSHDISMPMLVDRILLESYAPPCAIINEKGDILYIHGRTGKYLEPAPGEARLNILEMARQGLRMEMATAIRQATSKKQKIFFENLKVKMNGTDQYINLTVKPVTEAEAMEGLLIVVFEDVVPLKEFEETKSRSTKKTNKRIAELEQELRYTKENLQTTIEELETSNEELKSTNEELQSTNEELQSTNEELETSKEELQSLNEELTTVNTELQGRIDELSRANDDMKNLLDSTDIATIFLGIDLQVKRFTPRVTDIINLIPSDIDRPISHIVSNLKYDGLLKDAKKVLDTLATKETEVETKDGNWYLMRIMPYRTITNVIDGVVIVFENITASKIIKEELKIRAQQNTFRLATVVNDSNDAITLQDKSGNIITWNQGAEKMYGYSEKEALKMNIKEIVPDGKKKETLDFVKDIFQGKLIESFETQRLSKDSKTIDVWLTVTVLKDDKGNPEYIATTERDISRLKQGGATLKF
jgi:two-component system CheB/CheR fusion protein